jgi:hypothetical protein
MEVVEVAPPYDVNDNTAQLACRVMLDALGTMCVEGKLGHRRKVMKGAGRMPEVPTRRPAAKSAKRKPAARKPKRRRA